MADVPRIAPIERDVEQAITALKKGAYLLKYGRRGKPKFCPFRLSNDETTLIWYSGQEEKQLRLSDVSRIAPGQRTTIFQRYPRPEMEYQSFSLICNDRSLDLICKDKDEAEVWFTGLRALISGSQNRQWKHYIKSDGSASADAHSPVGYTRKNSPLSSPFGSTESLSQEGRSSPRPYNSPPHQNALSEGEMHSMISKSFNSRSIGGSVYSDVGSESTNLQLKTTSLEVIRVSLSSAVSSSSHGSGHDDDALGDVFMWGEGIGDGILGGGVHKIGKAAGQKMDALLPKALEFAVMLDVQNMACGGKHAALVTKHGELFCWGEESGGRLGHGIDADVSHPKLVEALANTHVELVACGEYHTCAVTLGGELLTWGDGTHNFGLLGHGNDASHWKPKLVGRVLDGIHVSAISCGPWHTALITSVGQLFTFGDGTFGVLGHGDTGSATLPREVESLKGLRATRVACGVWHTAAVVEVMVGSATANNCSSGKLFTWGDGDKGRLGHGDNEQKLVPTCVAALVEYNFRQVACGHSLTVALTTSGHVFTMGSPVYGQLGNRQVPGKMPGCVEGKIREEFIEEIACGAFHVAVLTSKAEVYTWGKGANGRLGHGDVDDRNNPTLVEALRGKQVKSVFCGSSFTAAICLHKWVSGSDQSMCSGCRLPFGFTRKRHNCYNCGLVFCHACSSKKVLKASLAPNPSKPYRVCDPCFFKLKKAAEPSLLPQTPLSRKDVRLSVDVKEKQEKTDAKVLMSQLSYSKVSALEQFKLNEGKQLQRHNRRAESASSRVSPVRNASSQWGTILASSSLYSAFGPSRRIMSASVPQSRIVSRATSPISSRRPSPPRSTTPTPTFIGLATPKSADNDLKKRNETMNHEILRLQTQVDNLTRRCQLQDVELKRVTHQLQEALVIAGEESAKCRAAKEVIKSLTSQLKDMAERLSRGVHRHGTLGTQQICNVEAPNGTDTLSTPCILSMREASDNSQFHVPKSTRNSNVSVQDAILNGTCSPIISDGATIFNKTTINHIQTGLADDINRLESKERNEDVAAKMSGNTMPTEKLHEPGVEWVEQDEPGVYLTLTALPGGGQDLKRVRFSRKRFSEKQAEIWWQENKTRVHEQYHVRLVERSALGASIPQKATDISSNSLSSKAG